MHDWGGLIDGGEVADAEHAQVRDSECSTLSDELVNKDRFGGRDVHTWYSWGCNLPSLAFLAKALASAEIVSETF